MTRLLLTLFCLLLLTTSATANQQTTPARKQPPAPAAQQKQAPPASARPAADSITLMLPESVLAEAVNAVVPLEVTATSKMIQGKITIVSISNLQLVDDHLQARLQVSGHNLELVTEVAGHQLRLKVGEVAIDVNVLAQLRFDAASQTLFVRPVIDEAQAARDAAGGDAGYALVSLLNGREFPVNMQKIDPIIARAGAKTVTIATHISDIRARKDMLQLLLAPRISSRMTAANP